MAPIESPAAPLPAGPATGAGQLRVCLRQQEHAWLLPVLLATGCALAPVSGTTLSLSKAVTGIVVVLVCALPVIYALTRRYVGCQVWYILILLTVVINFAVAVYYEVALPRWLRHAFGFAAFASVCLLTAYQAQTAAQRWQLCKWLACVMFLLLLRQAVPVSKVGAQEAFEMRVAGNLPWANTAMLLFFPLAVFARGRWSQVGIAGSLWTIVLIGLGGSRGAYLVAGVVALLQIMIALSLRRQFVRTTGALVACLLLAAAGNSIGVWEVMVPRYKRGFALRDDSVRGRIDEARSAIQAVSGQWETLLLGKGFGASYFIDYTIPTKKDQWEWIPPHSEYAAKMLHTGILGTSVLIATLLGTVLYIGRSLNRAREMPPSERVCLMMALSTAVAISLWGVPGWILYFWNANILYGALVGLGLRAAFCASENAPASDYRITLRAQGA